MIDSNGHRPFEAISPIDGRRLVLSRSPTSSTRSTRSSNSSQRGGKLKKVKAILFERRVPQTIVDQICDLNEKPAVEDEMWLLDEEKDCTPYKERAKQRAIAREYAEMQALAYSYWVW